MQTQETTVKVLTLVPEEGKFLTNYPTASILDAQISTCVFVREDLAGPWREIDNTEKEEIEALKEQALAELKEQEKEQENEQEDANI